MSAAPCALLCRLAQPSIYTNNRPGTRCRGRCLNGCREAGPAQHGMKGGGGAPDSSEKWVSQVSDVGCLKHFIIMPRLEHAPHAAQHLCLWVFGWRPVLTCRLRLEACPPAKSGGWCFGCVNGVEMSMTRRRGFGLAQWRCMYKQLDSPTAKAANTTAIRRSAELQGRRMVDSKPGFDLCMMGSERAPLRRADGACGRATILAVWLPKKGRCNYIVYK